MPLTDIYLGLHVGEVFYGNVGSLDRLDFTVVGPAVNEVSRIAAMCRSAERDVLLSAAFVAAACPEDRHRLVSVGRYALRGIAKAQELNIKISVAVCDTGGNADEVHRREAPSWTRCPIPPGRPALTGAPDGSGGVQLIIGVVHGKFISDGIA